MTTSKLYVNDVLLELSEEDKNRPLINLVEEGKIKSSDDIKIVVDVEV